MQKICFNPRTRTGCDMILTAEYNSLAFQSTHPHGVRRALTQQYTEAMMFQSTHPHGVRHTCSKPCYPLPCFNPRTRTGCDSVPMGHLSDPARFNPRTRTGCDDEFENEVKIIKVSIHAPARGATRSSTPANRQEKFQSTHPHGVRLRVFGFDNQTLWFQSTHPHGVRLSISRYA